MEKDTATSQKSIFNTITQFSLPIFTVMGFGFTSARMPEIGLIFNLIAQVFWLYSGWQAWKKADQIGLFITAVIITIVVLAGVVNYWLL